MADHPQRVDEPALEPDLEICDPHHHLWDHRESVYMLDELLDDLGQGHNVVSTVFLECMSGYLDDGPESHRPVGETRFVEAVADAAARRDGAPAVAAAIMSFADLTLGGAVGEVLDAHAAASRRFRGIRHAAGWDPSPDIRNSHTRPIEHLYLDTAFREGFAELARRDLVFDAWLYHPQIPEVASLADAFPDTTIVLDHFGGPLGIGRWAGRAREVFEAWRPAVTELSRRPNVVVKLGGLAMPINGFGWHKRDRLPGSEELADAQRPYHETCIELFGPDRCMFESNFPVDKVSCSYSVLWNAFKRIAGGASEDEKRALFRGTAERVYGI
ncbi:MAG: amidohydrolase family protein [Thermoanaerobaculia bacterium]|nr:amidohydrolase family protein [Thermoanaerobaculia bacterium]